MECIKNIFMEFVLFKLIPLVVEKDATGVCYSILYEGDQFKVSISKKINDKRFLGISKFISCNSSIKEIQKELLDINFQCC